MNDSTSRPLPYGRHWIDDADIAAVVEVLQSDWLTTGPTVDRFEHALAKVAGVGEAVAVSSGTAALHAAMHSLGIGPGDEVIVPPLTFVATANCVVYQGATPVFADVDPETLLIDPDRVAEKITPRTRAVIAVDYAGQPADYVRLRKLTAPRGIHLVADACHSLGGSDKGRPVGSLADITLFSFHPVKHITTAEGGALVTNDPVFARRARTFRNHGIPLDHRQREKAGSHAYEMVTLGFNYRLSDMQCALGLNQLGKLKDWVARRQEIAQQYGAQLPAISGLRLVGAREGATSAYHLYVVRLPNRDWVFGQLRKAGLGVNVHYGAVHLHPFYRQRFGTREGQCPVAESACAEVLSLPMFPRLSAGDIERVVSELRGVMEMRPGLAA